MAAASSWKRVQRYLITGLAVTAPVGLTAWVLAWLFTRLDAILGRYLPELTGATIPGLGLAALLLLLLAVGWVAHRAAGRRLLGAWERLLSRVPVVRRVYGAAAHVVESVVAREEKLFRACALIEYPSPGSHSLVFVTARSPREVEETAGSEMLSVFLPTVPNPTTGYLLMLPARRVHLLEMTVDEGFRMILSAGAAVPEADGATRSPRGRREVERLLAAEPAAAAEQDPAEGPKRAEGGEVGR